LEESDIDKDGTINLSEFQHVVSRSPDFARYRGLQRRSLSRGPRHWRWGTALGGGAARLPGTRPPVAAAGTASLPAPQGASPAQGSAACTEHWALARSLRVTQRGGAEPVASLAAPSRSSCERPVALQQNRSSGGRSSLQSQTFPLPRAERPRSLLLASPAVPHRALGRTPFCSRRRGGRSHSLHSRAPGKQPCPQPLCSGSDFNSLGKRGQRCGCGEAHRSAPGRGPRCTGHSPSLPSAPTRAFREQAGSCLPLPSPCLALPASGGPPCCNGDPFL